MAELINKRNVLYYISKNSFRAKNEGTGKLHYFVPCSEQVVVIFFCIFLYFFYGFGIGSFSKKLCHSERTFLMAQLSGF
ncbi:MAG: hypothetical protein ABRQ38_29130 [Candidatus Eremiobacterota bacterium]